MAPSRHRALLGLLGHQLKRWLLLLFFFLTLWAYPILPQEKEEKPAPPSCTITVETGMITVVHGESSTVQVVKVKAEEKVLFMKEIDFGTTSHHNWKALDTALDEAWNACHASMKEKRQKLEKEGSHLLTHVNPHED